MNDARDDSPAQPRHSTEIDGSTLAASSSESGGLYDDDGATLGASDGVPISDEDDDAALGEAPDIKDR